MDIEEARELCFGEISLQENQLVHFVRILGIAKEHRFYVDLSPTGRGKSFVSLFLGLVLGLKPFLFTEKNCLAVWKDFFAKVGIVDYDMMAYTMVPSRKGKEKAADGLLRREDFIKVTKQGKAVEKTRYHLTDDGRERLRGRLLILDEFHKCLGASLTFRAMTAINGYASKHSILAMLSATALTTVESVINFYRLIGVLTHKKIAMNAFGNLITDGFDQIRDHAYSINPRGTEIALQKRIEDIRSFGKMHQNLIVEIWNEALKPVVASRMEDFDVCVNGYRGAFTMTPEEETHYRSGIEDLATAVRWNGKSFNEGSWDNGLQQGALSNIELSKLGIFYRRVRWSSERPRTKVAVWVHYIRTLESISELLDGFNVAVIRGSTPAAERTRIIAKFQQPTDEITILLISSKSLTTGVSLHDAIADSTGKGWERHVYISPSFMFSETQQFLGRFLRIGYLSIPSIFIVYPEENPDQGISGIEQRIMELSERKAAFLKRSSSGAGSEVKTLFICEFPQYNEAIERYK
jgi:hypothetical protein